jgi:NADH:ubiquinone reductase (H+-translocating)
MRKPRIVVLGAGYGGLVTTKKLQKMFGVNEVDIVLINRNDYHYETTWLHEASAGTLHHDRVRYNIADVVDRSKVDFIMGTAVEINTVEQKIILENSAVEYDYLVVALGSEPETFGIKGLKEHAFSIMNINSARQIREHIEYQFATYQSELIKQEERLSIVVGGAGFTGIEFLGELANRVPELCREYDVDSQKVKLICVEAAPMVLPGFEPDLVRYAVKTLEKKGVEFRIGTAIKECTSNGIIVASGAEEVEEIKASTVIWAAGVRGNSIIEKSGFDSLRGRVKVERDLRAPGHDNIFIIGDCSLVINVETNRPYPPTAQVAMQQGEVCARNLVAIIRDTGELETFKPDIKGTVCSLGHDDAVGVVYGKKIFGTKASILKKLVDNRALYLMGGPSLVFRKGKFNML